MLRLRPYKACDARAIVSWIKDEVVFHKWSADKIGKYPLTEADLKSHYDALADTDSFFQMTAFDETGVVGHMIMRYLNEEKTVIRFGFIIIDDSKQGKGYGKEMLQLAIKYAFEILKVEKITLGVFENNEPAYGCYRAVGFQEMQPEQTNAFHFLNEEWICRELELRRTV